METALKFTGAWISPLCGFVTDTPNKEIELGDGVKLIRMPDDIIRSIDNQFPGLELRTIGDEFANEWAVWGMTKS